MHIMMVESQMEKDEMEDGMMYNIVNDGAVATEHEPSDNGDANNNIHLGEWLMDGEGDSATCDKCAKFEMVHKWWEALHDFEGLAKLKDAMKRYLYKIKF